MTDTTLTPQVPLIATGDLKRRLELREPFHFWNVLTDAYFKGELIRGSRRVPLDRVGQEAMQAELPKDAEIVVYCAGPTCPQSKQAAQKLLTLGYTSVRAYEGGLAEWKEHGHAVELLKAA